MKHNIIIQKTTKNDFTPKNTLIRQWAKSALPDDKQPLEITIRMVSAKAIAKLNEQYRHKQGATNVLSFPYEGPAYPELAVQLLGDVVICPAVLLQEATAEQKELTAHFAHIVIHGVLHLQGYDHQNDQDASEMEALEIKLLKKLGFNNPYD